MQHAFTFKRTTGTDADFQSLVIQLDSYLADINGAENDFFVAFNGSLSLAKVIVAYHEGRAVGCGALRNLENGTFEIKRMFTRPTLRRQRLATQVLQHLEAWAVSSGGTRCILETHAAMLPAIALYEAYGYRRIPNYPPYTDSPHSVCLEKTLF